MRLRTRFILYGVLPMLLVMASAASLVINSYRELLVMRATHQSVHALNDIVEAMSAIQSERFHLLLSSTRPEPAHRSDQALAKLQNALPDHTAIQALSQSLIKARSSGKQADFQQIAQSLLQLEAWLVHNSTTRGIGKVINSIVLLSSAKARLEDLLRALQIGVTQAGPVRQLYADCDYIQATLSSPSLVVSAKTSGLLSSFIASENWNRVKSWTHRAPQPLDKFEIPPLRTKLIEAFNTIFREEFGAISVAVNEIESDMQRQFAWLLGGLIAALIANLSFAYYAARIIIGPLEQVVAFANGITTGDRDSRLTLVRHDEFGELAAVLNTMIEQISKTEELFRTVADYTYDWEYWMGPDGRLIWMAPACESATGYTAKEFFDNPELLMSLIVPESKDTMREHLCAIQEKREAECLNIVFKLTRRDGAIRSFEHHCQAIYDSHGNLLGRRSCNRDITAKLQAEKERQEMQAQVFHSSKLASIGTLAAGVAHEINNPLTIILGNISILKALREQWETQGPSPACSGCLETLGKQERAVQRIVGIVNGLRTYARADNDSVTEVDMHDVIRDTLALIGQIYKKANIEIECTLESQQAIILGNTGKMQQVLMNLLSNAKDAIERVENPRIRILTADREGQVAIEVSDNGAGMSREVRERIFDPFYTTKDPGKGTGLGLTIIHSIITTAQGKIEVRSEPGKGSTFALSFPRVNAPNGPDCPHHH